jgi:flagellar protein FliJ
MKRFRYPLEGLMRLKKARLDQEILKMEQIAAGIIQVEQHRLALDRESREATRAAALASTAEGWQLVALDRFRRYAIEQDQRLAAELQRLGKRLEEQRQAVVDANKNVRMLELLKERRLSGWREEVSKEEEAIVSDLVIAQWGRRPQ